uniref:DNA replication ATP-dependent helicase/nuclease DNA2 n=1 Tax=Gasterosteus aculeatus aculeatus TaxID=481459 RepID=A0AAQ4R859_GASAC
MNRTKLKKNKTADLWAQKNISTYFSSQNQQKALSTSPKSTGTAFARTESPINDGETHTFGSRSPLKRSVLGDLENFLPSSPDLLSVPETPTSQIRGASPSSYRNPGRPSPQPSSEESLQELCQLSPICRSPRSRGQSARIVMTQEGRKTKREEGCSGSVKRVISPPQDSNDAKRRRNVDVHAQRTAHCPSGSDLTVAGPLIGVSKTPHLLGDQRERSEGHSGGVDVVFNENKDDFAEQRNDDAKDCGFTGITEQKAAQVQDTRALTAHAHKPRAQTPTTAATKRSEPEARATVTAMTPSSETGAHVTSDQRAGDKGTTASCPVEGVLDESWFAEQMGDAVVTDDTSKKPRKVPDHVILCGGPNNRYWVLDVDERPGLKTLTVSCSKSFHPTETCLLRDGWEMTPVCCGDVVHLEGRSGGGSLVVDREQGFLVLLPDSLLSGTSISNSIRCMRQAVLGDMFKSFDGGSKQMLNGTMVHEVFQRAATAKDFSLATLSRMADQALLFRLEEMKQELQDYLPSLEHWAKEYLSSPTPKSISLKIAPSRCQDAATVVTVAELADIEENVWSPRFGLKGKIDVTARIRIQNARSGSRGTPEERTVPLELKTGKESNSIEHRSQVILYTLMSWERYNSEAGLLLYLKTGHLHPVVASHMDRRELLKLRNTLVHHIHNCVEKEAKRSRLSQLPEILTNRRTCQYCPQKRNCALYESYRVLLFSTSSRFETGHLIPPHLSYFSHWLLLCCLEAASMEAKNGRKRVWLQTPEESEKTGSCVGNVQLSGPVAVRSEGVFLHRFQRSSAGPQEGLASSGLASGDRIVVSDQEGRLVGLATGYLCEVSRTSISCTLDRDLSKFSGVLFRLDGDEGVVGLSTHLTNLSRLMESCPDSDRLRELVVDLRPPEFIHNLSSVLPREAKDTVANILKGLNKPQKQAMKKVLLSKDYTLIVGMPGTGKTTTICTLVPALESVEKGGVSNHTEAALIHNLLSMLIKAGCRPSDVGVIAPYRQQLKSISTLLQSSAFTGVEVNTVDRYQGRDKSVIIFSFVRSTSEEGNLGELLKDWRRLNVAITRAKHKLLMVGSATTLRRYAPVEKLLNHLQQENMISFNGKILFNGMTVGVDSFIAKCVTKLVTADVLFSVLYRSKLYINVKPAGQLCSQPCVRLQGRIPAGF